MSTNAIIHIQLSTGTISFVSAKTEAGKTKSITVITEKYFSL